MGLILYSAAARPGGTRQWKLAVFSLFAANAADLDFLPGLVVGDLARFHHGPSHSIGFAVLFGILASLLFSRRLNAFCAAASLYLSHVVLDYLIQDPSLPRGVPLLWPFNSEYYMAPFAFFRQFDYAAKAGEPMLSELVTLHNFVTIGSEILLLLPALILVCFWRRTTGSAKLVCQTYE